MSRYLPTQPGAVRGDDIVGAGYSIQKKILPHRKEAPEDGQVGAITEDISEEVKAELILDGERHMELKKIGYTD